MMDYHPVWTMVDKCIHTNMTSLKISHHDEAVKDVFMELTGVHDVGASDYKFTVNQHGTALV
jgi:hypothetical protein